MNRTDRDFLLQTRKQAVICTRSPRPRPHRGSSTQLSQYNQSTLSQYNQSTLSQYNQSTLSQYNKSTRPLCPSRPSPLSLIPVDPVHSASSQ
ncbi:hypothetical protein EYF80_024853 [Liparis tanakae]|uniref:Uncharacterized protein n=1 Tax=Liparis tanakae TaxID=230148 RepID=A0A4Z2HGH4_9TELE|nr:hypothetical protein EYF80_024853 [Liparis tanakae]